MRSLSQSFVLALTLGGLSLTACNKNESGAEQTASAQQAAAGSANAASAPDKAGQELLSFIPADTPYIYASLQTTADLAITQRVLKMLDPLLTQVEDEMKKVRAELDPKDDVEKMIIALSDEFFDKLSVEGFKQLGISLAPRYAIYGVGVLPVFRIELGDAALFLAMLERVEGKTNLKSFSATLGEQRYYRIEDDEITVAFGVAQGALVLTGGPAKAMPTVLPIAFGQEKPAESLANSKKWAQFSQEGGYLSFGAGYLDVELVRQFVTGEATGLNQKIRGLLDLPPVELDETCNREIKGLVAQVPRLSAGYTTLNDQQMSMRFRFDLEPSLAKSLSKFNAPVPGLGTIHEALVSFGVGVNLPAILDFAQERLKALQAEPFKCALLTDINEELGELATELPQMRAQMPAFVEGLKGFNLVAESFEMVDDMPKNVRGYAILALDNPETLLAMAQGFVPQLAQFKLAADGTPAPLPADLLPPDLGIAFAALGEKAIAVSLGKGSEERLARALKAAPEKDPPLLAGGYDMKRFSQLMGKQGQLADDERALFEALSQLFGQVQYALRFTEQGAELTMDMRLP